MADADDVVVTGLGLITSAGVGVGKYEDAIREGRVGISTINEFDTSVLPVKIGGMVRDFDPATVLDAKQVRLAARIVQFAVGCAIEATGTDKEGAFGDGTRYATMVGTSTGGLEVIAEQMEVLHTKGPRRVSPFAVPQLMDNAAAAWIALRWGFRGPAYSISTACATSMDGIGIAADMIRSGRLDGCLVGGSEAAVSPFVLATFERGGILSRRNDDPLHALRPFDKERDGLVLGEGCCLLMLERRSVAEKRGARVLARLAGYGSSSNAQVELLRASVDGKGLATAMQGAITQAGIKASDIGYVSAQGDGLPDYDASESAAIHAVFGADAEKVPVGATKSFVGYTLGASGAIGAMAAILAVNKGLLTPVASYRTPDPACRLNIIADKAREQKVNYAIANAIGFGGANSSIVFAAP